MASVIGMPLLRFDGSAHRQRQPQTEHALAGRKKHGSPQKGQGERGSSAVGVVFTSGTKLSSGVTSRLRRVKRYSA